MGQRRLNYGWAGGNVDTHGAGIGAAVQERNGKVEAFTDMVQRLSVPAQQQEQKKAFFASKESAKIWILIKAKGQGAQIEYKHTGDGNP
ncbi:hypothetical protein MMC06_001897 [Schaereria dolodes]|nr:hypothetical protein [Schaereria dolodes]